MRGGHSQSHLNGFQDVHGISVARSNSLRHSPPQYRRKADGYPENIPPTVNEQDVPYGGPGGRPNSAFGPPQYPVPPPGHPLHAQQNQDYDSHDPRRHPSRGRDRQDYNRGYGQDYHGDSPHDPQDYKDYREYGQQPHPARDMEKMPHRGRYGDDPRDHPDGGKMYRPQHGGDGTLGREPRGGMGTLPRDGTLPRGDGTLPRGDGTLNRDRVRSERDMRPPGPNGHPQHGAMPPRSPTHHSQQYPQNGSRSPPSTLPRNKDEQAQHQQQHPHYQQQMPHHAAQQYERVSMSQQPDSASVQMHQTQKKFQVMKVDSGLSILQRVGGENLEVGGENI